jgi:hypothetical protein
MPRAKEEDGEHVGDEVAARFRGAEHPQHQDRHGADRDDDLGH